MPKKKPEEPEQSADDKALEHRVDVMMSTELAEVSALAAEKLGAKKPAGKSDTAAEQKTVPKLPAKFTKAIEAPEASEPKVPAEPPIVITLADEAEAEPEPEPAPAPEPAQSQTQENDPLEDSSTNEAVDDIVAKEGDTILAVGDAMVAREQKTASLGQTSGGTAKHKWLWFLVLVVLLGTAADVYLFVSR
jgi:hypothetical protein